MHGITLATITEGAIIILAGVIMVMVEVTDGGTWVTMVVVAAVHGLQAIGMAGADGFPLTAGAGRCLRMTYVPASKAPAHAIGFVP